MVFQKSLCHMFTMDPAPSSFVISLSSCFFLPELFFKGSQFLSPSNFIEVPPFFCFLHRFPYFRNGDSNLSVPSPHPSTFHPNLRTSRFFVLRVCLGGRRLLLLRGSSLIFSPFCTSSPLSPFPLSSFTFHKLMYVPTTPFIVGLPITHRSVADRSFSCLSAMTFNFALAS